MPTASGCRGARLAAILIGLLVLAGVCAAADVTAPTVQISQATAVGTTLTAYVAVRDAAGAAATGVTADRVSATVGTRAATVTDLKSFAETDEGVAYLFLVDVSRSITGRRFEQLREALLGWVKALAPNDRAGLIAFGSQVRTLVPPTADQAALNAAIAALAPTDRNTHLHQALVEGLQLGRQQTVGVPTRRAIVVLSDGLDDAPGGLTAAEVLAQMDEGLVPIYAISFQAPRDAARRARGLDALGQFARRSGGVLADGTSADPAAALEAMRQRIREVYRVRLQCDTCVLDGNRYRLQLALVGADGPLTDGMDLRLYPAAGTAPATVRPAQPEPPTAAPAPAAVAPPPAPRPRGLWPYLIAAAAALLALVLLVVWVLRRRRAGAADERSLDSCADATGPTDADSGDRPTRPVPGGASGTTLSLTFMKGQRRGQSVRLTLAPAVLLGRATDCDLALSDDDQVSAHHARLALVGRRVVLEDLGSANHTFLNGVAIRAPHPVAEGDLVRLGTTELRIGFQHPENK